MFEKIDFDSLNHLQVGKIGEYWAKLALSLYGLDVYTTEVDDKGIDFVIRMDGNSFIEMQVKTLRKAKSAYIFIPKKNAWSEEKIHANLMLALVLLENGKTPELFLIPSVAWQQDSPLLKSRDYGEGYKSAPEWGVNLSAKTRPFLEEFSLEKQVIRLINGEQ